MRRNAATDRLARRKGGVRGGSVGRKAKLGIVDRAWANRVAEAHDGLCQLCGEAAARWCLDHDHRTGEPRGVLCIRCNTGLGMFRDDPWLLRLAAGYVEEPPGLAFQEG